MPDAASISIRETISLLDGEFSGLSKGVAQGEYAFWLGSGISRDRVVGLDGVLAKLLEFLRIHATPSADCGYGLALKKIIKMASPSEEERRHIDLGQSVSEWPCLTVILGRLWKQYSAVLSVEIPGEKLDHLLWVGLDFPRTFKEQSSDAEHLVIGMLALEGVVTHLATANWDGLLEAAMTELGHETLYQITVTGEDLRGPPAAATLYKFHGCALRAIADETLNRPLLVARTAQITGWKSNETFKIVRDQLGTVVQKFRTLMIGMSAQDENIKHLFASMNAQKGWNWASQPTPIVFSSQELGDDQKNVLIGVYGEPAYEAYRDEICSAARLQAYSKPLLLGLLIHVLAAKLEALAGDANAANLDDSARKAIAEGIRALRDRVADTGSADRLELARAIAAGLTRARRQLADGTSDAGTQQYFPLDSAPVHLMKEKPALKSSGLREAAVALGLIGLEEQAANWVTSVDDPSDRRTGALKMTSSNASARVFFAANDTTITSLLEGGAFEETDQDAVVICSGRVSDRQQRSPSATMRSGNIGPRYVAFGSILRDATDLDVLRGLFRGEVGL